jgi:hypothetical protein
VLSRPSIVSLLHFRNEWKKCLPGWSSDGEGQPQVISGHCRVSSTIGIRLRGMAIGINPLFIRLTLRPDTSPKACSMVEIVFRFIVCAVVMMAMPSANCRTVVCMVGIEISWSLHFCRMVWIVSIARNCCL